MNQQARRWQAELPPACLLVLGDIFSTLKMILFITTAVKTSILWDNLKNALYETKIDAKI
jgi:hypothetical protein